MTPTELVAFLPRNCGLEAQTRRRFINISREHGLAPQALPGGAALATKGPIAAGSTSVVVGHVFSRAGTDRERLAPGDGFDGELSRPPRKGHWGDYLALTCGRTSQSHRLVRPAFGNLPCFWFEHPQYIVAASSVALLERYLPKRPVVDWRGLGAFVLSPQMRNGSTCLEGVRELPSGFALEVGPGKTVVKPVWCPWEHACSDAPFASLDDAAGTLRTAIDQAIAARCARMRSPVLLLSGGLDSSIIAASLAQCGVSFSALTMVTRHRSGDERIYARAVAEAIGGPLAECLRMPDDVDWEDRTPRRLVRPSARLFRQPTLRAARLQARKTGGHTIIDGGGGDDLFCSLNSVVPLLDRVAIEGVGPGAWQTARQIALRADVDILTVLRRAAHRRLSRRVAFRWPIVPDFLTRETLQLADEAIQHPWLEPPPGALPGQAAHVALVLDALSLSEDDSLDPAMRTISPLVALPVVECALRVRSWLWFQNGRSRAVVRHAFAARLPSAITARAGKGTPTGFVSELVEHHRARLQDLLLDGVLVAHGVAEPAAIEDALSDRATIRGDRFGRLLALADAERWARQWA